MNTLLSRRHLLASGAAAVLAGPLAGSNARAATPVLMLTRRTLEVNGKAAAVYGILRPGGKPGLTLAAGARFAVSVNNQCGTDSIIHWHGQTPPAAQDGVTDTGYVTPIAAGAARDYEFTPRPGTHWMHSHQGLQEQSLMAAPLIVHSAAEVQSDVQEVVVLLHDFSFRAPAEILASLTGRSGGMGGMAGGGMMSGAGAMDLNDITFDAYLANDRTLDDPEIVTAAAGGQIRLRLINGAAATNFWIDLSALSGQLVAVDGNAVQPVTVSLFPLAGGQRADVLLRLPAAGAYPLIAQREGAVERTGIILATPGAAIAKLTGLAKSPAVACNLGLEAQFAAAQPLSARAPDRVYRVSLTGGMMGYDWGLNGLPWANHQPLNVKPGERVAIDMVSDSMMAHPMHLHGHHFQIAAVNRTAVSGAMRDTVLVPPMGSVRIVFDADNPGRWLFHCHNLYHMASGMMTEVVYV
jgi:FtsP/CotA-like multicopper oxidase with cupredoxin domain